MHNVFPSKPPAQSPLNIFAKVDAKHLIQVRIFAERMVTLYK